MKNKQINKIIDIVKNYFKSNNTFTKFDIFNSYKLSENNDLLNYSIYKRIITSIIEELITEYDYKKNDIIKTIYLPIDNYGRIYISSKITKNLCINNEMLEYVYKYQINNKILIFPQFEYDSEYNYSILKVNKYNSFHISLGKNYSLFNNIKLNIYKNKLEIVF